MRVYSVDSRYGRRFLKGGVPPVGERKPCACGNQDVNYPPPEQYWKNIELDQGSFVSSILHAWKVLGVTGELKDALQKEGFEGLEFEPIEIVEDNRPSKDRKKLPLEQIPQFYRCKYLTSIPMHQDYTDLYDVTPCPDCGRAVSNHLMRKLILDGNRHPTTDFFGLTWSGRSYGTYHLCTERAKTFLEAYPHTHCSFDEEEVRCGDE